MPYVHLTMLDRGLKKKRAAIKAITDGLVKVYGIPRAWVHIIVTEITKEQDAVGGELLVDLEKKRVKKGKKRKNAKR